MRREKREGGINKGKKKGAKEGRKKGRERGREEISKLICYSVVFISSDIGIGIF